MKVNTKRVANRRTLAFRSLQEVLAEAERLAADTPTMLGNWSLGQTLAHLARAMDMAVDGFPFRVAWVIRLVGSWMKKWMLSRPMAPGFKLPRRAEEKLVPREETSTADGLAMLRRAVERFRKGPLLARHDILGAMTSGDWEMLQLRHAELHLSFAVPSGD